MKQTKYNSYQQCYDSVKKVSKGDRIRFISNTNEYTITPIQDTNFFKVKSVDQYDKIIEIERDNAEDILQINGNSDMDITNTEDKTKMEVIDIPSRLFEFFNIRKQLLIL